MQMYCCIDIYFQQNPSYSDIVLEAPVAMQEVQEVVLFPPSIIV